MTKMPSAYIEMVTGSGGSPRGEAIGLAKLMDTGCPVIVFLDGLYKKENNINSARINVFIQKSTLDLEPLFKLDNTCNL